MAQKREETEVAGVRLTSPDRVLYPQQGISKREMAEYYVAVAERILPHLRGRPLTLVRCPSGQGTECFYQRRAGKGTPEALGRVRVPVQGEMHTYLTADTLGAVLSLVQMGVLELHVWGARRDRLDRPDRLVLDLDPAPGVAWREIADGARRVRERLSALGLESFVKTTGGKGLHVVAPLVRRRDWDTVRDFARAVAEGLVREDPDRFLAEASKEERGGKIYVDYVRNAWSATAVAPYSSRAREGAPVSCPLSWDELGPGSRPDRFTVRTVAERVEAQEDPWAGFAELRQGITKKMMREVGVE